MTNITTGAYVRFDLNASGLANISKTGVSKFMIAFDQDITDTEPTWVSDQASYIDADFAEGTNSPRLAVNHS